MPTSTSGSTLSTPTKRAIPPHEWQTFTPRRSPLAVEILYLVLGAICQAVAYACFIAPANIVPGGCYGLSITINYLTQGGTPWLDRQYTVFGEVIDGMRTITKIEDLPTDKTNRPKRDVIIKRMTLLP